MLRRLIKACAIVIGVGLMAAGCAVTPVKMGSAAILGDQRISIATLGAEVADLSQAVKQYPGIVNMTASQQTQNTLSWLIRYQVNDELARQNGITVSTAQAQAALAHAYTAAITAAEQQGLTNVTPTLVLAYSGVPPNTAAELGRYEAIANEYLKIANGGTTPITSSAQAAAESKLSQAECQAGKALNIMVNPQFGQLDYTEFQVVPAPSAVTRPQGPFISPSPVATAPAC